MCNVPEPPEPLFGGLGEVSFSLVPLARPSTPPPRLSTLTSVLTNGWKTWAVHQDMDNYLANTRIWTTTWQTPGYGQLLGKQQDMDNYL